MTNVPLKELFAEFPLLFTPVEIPNTPITGIAIDSRRVEAGNLFIAWRGGSADGHAFVPAAIERGAAAIVGEREMTGLPVPYIRVENSIEAVTWLAAAFYGWPGRSLTVIGVTGTDGKTTTCNLLYQVMLAAGLKAGLISTVNAVIGGEVLDTGFHVTTPDAPDVQFYLSKMVAAGLTHVILETTSHGLAQRRTDAAQYDVAVVTNVTHEHLDQHGSYENYRAAKARLFQLLAVTADKPQGNPRLAVLNRDDSSYAYLSSIVHRPSSAVCYGLNGEADVRAENISYSPQGIRFDAAGPGFRVPVTSALVGEFNVSNCLAALTAAVRGLGVDPETAARGLAALTGVPGRMERIDLGQPFTAIVDFAHTPNALRVAINAVRKMIGSPLPQSGEGSGVRAGRVIAIFGSAGLRDKEKRRMMAEVAAELADVSILTAEDPRTESLDGILEEMAAGARSRGGTEGQAFVRVADRGEAIRFGVRMAAPGDVVIACGKGHEQSMCFGETEYPWDDRTAMRAALAELVGAAGPAMPYLPTQEK
ncbi:MAG: UDP-N-acetylmuramoyl-L-alanyl-D-glutamate--2 6-diaminopimelate ligase [Anaerolineaceae bacterium]|nr:MAG: UDP-N-acetylmuramoyl-L-alanyl-D-glutamate--2 6-diaminopimelate ligase [Anaerolineaceae bacterium]